LHPNEPNIENPTSLQKMGFPYHAFFPGKGDWRIKSLIEEDRGMVTKWMGMSISEKKRQGDES
jgi:hypothetical protein